MSKFNEYINYFLWFVYKPTINLMDLIVIAIIIPALCGIVDSIWPVLFTLPWVVCSVHMQHKYNRD